MNALSRKLLCLMAATAAAVVVTAAVAMPIAQTTGATALTEVNSAVEPDARG